MLFEKYLHSATNKMQRLKTTCKNAVLLRFDWKLYHCFSLVTYTIFCELLVLGESKYTGFCMHCGCVITWWEQKIEPHIDSCKTEHMLWFAITPGEQWYSQSKQGRTAFLADGFLYRCKLRYVANGIEKIWGWSLSFLNWLFTHRLRCANWAAEVFTHEWCRYFLAF